MSNTFGDLVGEDKSFVVLAGRIPRKFMLRCESFIPRSELVRDKAWNPELGDYYDEPITLANECPHAFADYVRYVYFGDVPEISPINGVP
jgi:hypothetical protein